ncbi:hypothetical protein [Roseomonas sp. BN140053]|uniref:hypothetical protein n=1 Tax=Roseomonas sp. BN140053 TaxID=3391898 RepID=UPI0039E9347C
MQTATQAEFARMHDVARKTVTDWKSRGYVTMIGGRVDVEASNRTLASVGRSRLSPVTLNSRSARLVRQGNADGAEGSAKRVRTARSGAMGNATPAEATLHRHARDFPHVLALATLASCPGDLALALLDHLPMATVRPLVEGVVAKGRAAAVELVEDEDTPAGFDSWADHPWFTGPPMTEAEWQEIGAEWRGSKV